MAQGAVARRYAEAVFDLAKKSKTIDRWRSDLRTAAGILSDPKLIRVLEDPKVPRAAKRQILDDAFTVKLDPLVQNLLYLLAERARLGLVPRITDEFVEMANREEGVVIANVTTAVALSEAQQKKVQDRLRQLTGAQKIDLRLNTDPRIIGGMIARVGDELYDGSVRTKLNELQERLT
jgi:F-type H+-transporting ATPase subunit delta